METVLIVYNIIAFGILSVSAIYIQDGHINEIDGI